MCQIAKVRSEKCVRFKKFVPENVKINEKWRRDYMTLAMKIDEERDIAELKK